jgi:Na+-driven multidrug efflux pump
MEVTLASRPLASPTTRELLQFCIPLLGMGLVTPLLSLVDSAVVGRQSALGLASLAPATTLCDWLTYMLYPLGQVTTNFVASALAQGERQRERRTVRMGLVLAVGCGVALCALLLLASGPLLGLLATSDFELLLPYARAYTCVRALGMPAALSFVVLQASFLGAKKWRPPVIAAAVACVANLIADVLLVVVLRMGVVGAAMGTIAAQYGAAATLLVLRARELRAVPVADGEEGREAERTEEAEGTKGTEEARAVARTQGEVGKPRCATSESSLHDDGVAAWARFGLPLVLGQVARVLNIGLITAAATAGGAVAAAAHQVCMAFFWAICPFSDAVSTTAQAFLPGVQVGPSRTRATALRVRMLRLGAANGLLVAALCTLPLGVSALFTTDAVTRSLIHRIVPTLSLSAFIFSVASSAESILVANGDTPFIAFLYAVAPAATAVAIYIARGVLGIGSGPSQLIAAWAAFACFHVLRLLAFGGRVISAGYLKEKLATR